MKAYFSQYKSYVCCNYKLTLVNINFMYIAIISSLLSGKSMINCCRDFNDKCLISLSTCAVILDNKSKISGNSKPP